MAKSLQDYIMYFKKDHPYIIKLLYEPSKEELDRYKTLMDKYEVKSMSELDRLPFQTCPLDFPNITDGVNVYQFKITFGYPVEERNLLDETGMIFGVPLARIVVKRDDSPIESNIKLEKDDEYMPLLTTDEVTPVKEKIDTKDYYGNEYLEDMNKALSSKEYKNKNEIYKEYKSKKKV